MDAIPTARMMQRISPTPALDARLHPLSSAIGRVNNAERDLSDLLRRRQQSLMS
jgi:hypothetical protein